MKRLFPIILFIYVLALSCTSQKKLAYLSNLSTPDSSEVFTLYYPEYSLKPRDILYISIIAMNPEGAIINYLVPSGSNTATNISQGEVGSYLYGYNVNDEGIIQLPVIGNIKVGDLTLEEARKTIQSAADKVFKNSLVECKLLSFKFTVIGEVRSPGTYFNYNNYLTVLEAIGRAGGLNDYGRRDNVLVVRSSENGARTFRLNLQDKKILSSEVYFLLPNDVVIVEPESKKVFNLNLPTFSFILTSVVSAVTTTLLLINYLNKP